MYKNAQAQRHQLHKQLIDEQNTPCACGSFDRREIHRKVPQLGYLPDNVLVRCFNCHHFIDHPNSKFRVNDRVVLNGRTPQYIDLARHRPRTVIAIHYDPVKQANYYRLGSNGKGEARDGQPLDGIQFYEFRSYMLLAYKPRYYHFKRQYRRVK